MHSIFRWVCLAIAAVVATSPSARAQDRSPDPYDPYDTTNFNWRHGNVSISAVAGIAGKAKLADTTLDLDATLGLVARYEHPINRYMILGGTLGVLAWVPSLSNARGAGRSTLFDLTLLPKLRYPFSERFEVFVETPIGFCGSIPDNGLFGGIPNIAGGYTAQGFVGAHLGLSPSTGLVVEGGYAMHWFTHHVSRATGVKYTVDVALREPMIVVGFYARN